MEIEIEKIVFEVCNNDYSEEEATKKFLILFSVSKRSELLAFLGWHYEDDLADQKTKETIIDAYLNKS